MRDLSATMSAKTTLWMCVALAAGIVAAWLVVVLATPTKPAEAAFPSNNGKIVFYRWLNSHTEIFTMKPNGDNKTRLTNNREDDSNPVYSPNGKMIAFESNRSGGGDIYTMSANGTNKKRVPRSNSGVDSNPAWSPDGTKIAFSSTRTGNRDIYVINKDGTGLTRITTSRYTEFGPAWSPDGTRIAFGRTTCPECGDAKIYVMKAAPQSETNRAQRLTTSGPDVVEGAPAWSPDGTRIAFGSEQSSSVPNGFQSDLYSIRADGSGQIRLTTTTRGTSPAWSPDGTKIAFEGLRENDGGFGIFVMKAAPESETNRPKRLTRGGSAPDWQPLR
jgi:Tol biopolymer transport system component